MSGQTSAQVRLANELAVHFHHEPPAVAAAEIARHIRAFWEPRMRAELLRQVEADPDALDPLVPAAARLLAVD
ncbi:formate dehydrogenase subunit delta [Micromonospora sp. NPDC049559]|uniref:formate dehydrogenase subunit delta n=1 Tax=Micromonospora sp. NPDC049559 TaxID=3155923 RepID=UPI0034369D3B